MTTQQQDNTFEIKVPIFCEWTFENDLENPIGLYGYVSRIANSEEPVSLSGPDYPLPGFPGIEYYLHIYYWQGRFCMEFNVITEYNKFIFDVDFTCTTTDSEPKHFIKSCNNEVDDDDTSFNLYTCYGDCAGSCPVHKKNFVVRVEGSITVKKANGGFWGLYIIEVSDESKQLSKERIDTKDFDIIVKEQEIRVHKLVLAENSTVFARMFDCDNWKEAQESKIVIPDFSYEIVKYAVDACYGETFQLPTKEKILMFFQFADKYDMEKLIERVKKVIDFNPYNAIEYTNFFFENNAIELVNCCIDYLLSCAQYSVPIKDIELMDFQINVLIVTRMFDSPVLKKDPKLEHRSLINNSKNKKVK